MKYSVLISICIFFTSCHKLTTERSYRPTYPPLLNEMAIDTLKFITKGPYKESRKGFKETINSIRQYRFLSYSYPQNSYYPFWLNKLGIDLQNCNFDTLAYYEINKLLSLDNVNSFPKDIKRINSLNDLKNLPHAIQLKLAAKLKKEKEFKTLSLNYVPQNNYSLLQLSYAYMYKGDFNKACQTLKAAVKPDKHIRLEKRSSTTAGAVALAFALNRFDLIDSLSSWITDENGDTPPQEYSRLNNNGEPNRYSLNQWRSSLSIIGKFKQLSKIIKHRKNFDLKNLKNGEFEGSCLGFIDTIKVNITVSNHSITDIKILENNEDRPQSSLEIIPKRIINSQSLKVDAITSATVSSAAILASVSEAAIKAQ